MTDEASFSGSPEAGSMRAKLVSLVMCLGFALIAGKAGLVATTSPAERITASGVFDEPIRRADIVDRNGELLATSVSVYSLFADPRAIWDPAEVAMGVASVLPDIDVDELTLRLSNHNRAFEWVRRGLTPRQRQAIYDLGLEGLDFREESRRAYPRGTLAGHILGYAGADGQGLAGVEYAMDFELLAGGAPLKLTIDSNVQFALEAELAASAGEHDAEGGAGVILNARNGEVLALASWPPIDPNRVFDLGRDDPARLNRASGAVYELGSVFKPLTVAAALDTGAIRPSDRFDVREPLIISGRKITDTHPISGHASPTEIISESSNIGTVKVAVMLGARRQQEMLAALGLFSRSPVEIAGSAAPILPEQFDDIHAATVSYGHGIAVSPIAFASAFSVFANGGEVIEPTLIVDSKRRRRTKRVFSAPTAAVVTQMLREAVIHGTGEHAEVAGYRVAGKTGTAEKPVQGGYSDEENIASFAAVFPADSPDYVVLIVLDAPKQGAGLGRTAAYNAAPTAGRVIERVAPMLGVEPKFEDLGRGDNPMVRSVSERRSSL